MKQEIANGNDEQIIAFLKQAEAGMSIKANYRYGGFSQATFSKLRTGFGGIDASDAAQLRDPEAENNILKKLLAAPISVFTFLRQ